MVSLKTHKEIEMIRIAGQIVKGVIQKLKSFVVPNKTTQDIDDYVAELIAQEEATSAFKGYRGFPANICVSINEEVVHGIPSEKRINWGDIVSLDFGISYKGYFADAAITLPIGEIKPSVSKLIRVTQESLWRGIIVLSLGWLQARLIAASRYPLRSRLGQVSLPIR